MGLAFAFVGHKCSMMHDKCLIINGFTILQNQASSGTDNACGSVSRFATPTNNAAKRCSERTTRRCSKASGLSVSIGPSRQTPATRRFGKQPLSGRARRTGRSLRRAFPARLAVAFPSWPCEVSLESGETQTRTGSSLDI